MTSHAQPDSHSHGHSHAQARPRVVVVGGGIAGLTAATFAARSGASVVLLESVSELGGRARTRDDGDFRFNMGPHALYRNGPAEEVLSELGVRPTGSPPDTSRGLAWDGGGVHVLPGGPMSLLTTSLLGARDKLALGAMLARFPKLDPAPWFERTLRDFLSETFQSQKLRQVFEALVRLTSYANAPDHMSAGTAIAQVQGGLLGGVRYLDGGWQPMVDAIADKARDAGVEIRAAVRVRAVEDERRGLVLRLRDDSQVEADAVVLALGPTEASPLVASGGDPFLSQQADTSLPVRATCLEVGLSRLPDPKRPFLLGIDEPTYLSLHSSAASGLAPQGGATFHVARYLAPDEKPERAAVEAQLEAQLDAAQPGWRDSVSSKKLLLDVRVAHAVPTAEMGGVPGRPAVDALAGTHPGLMLAGDWVGPVGWLADASFASGRDAGRSAVQAARARARG